MSPENISPPGKTHLWIAAGIIVMAAVIGGATTIYVLHNAPERGMPTMTAVAVATSSTAPASATPAPISTATPSITPTLPPVATPIPDPGATLQAEATPPVVRAKVEIVWPHDSASVRDADLANITVYLIDGSGAGRDEGRLEPPPCGWAPVVRLWGALNNLPAREIAVGEKRMFTTGGRTYPVWDFNDIDVTEARDPADKLTFFVTVDGVTALTNVWAHASDARTIFPQADVPAGVLRTRPTAVDARIQIVWPHDNLPLAEAARANVTAYLFEAGTLQAFAPESGWDPTVRLHWSVNSEPERADSSVIGEARIATTGTGLRFLAWDFDDVDTSATQDPLNRLYFWVTVDDVTTYSNVWAHGVDARTIFPQADVLSSCR